MISYIISIGYNPSHPDHVVGEALRQVVADLRSRPQQIASEALRLEAFDDRGKVLECAEQYRHDRNDMTLRIREQNALPLVMQSASGGGEDRQIKESLRRAFCRLVIEAMHRQRMEVNLDVI